MGIQPTLSGGSIHIANEVTLIAGGEKVSAPVAKLLKMLKIEQFSYGLTLHRAFDNGKIYSTDVWGVAISGDTIAKGSGPMDPVRLLVSLLSGISC